MAQTGFTPIQLYSTSTAAAAPVAGNLTNSTLGSELAINITDGKLFYKDNANAVQVIGWKTVPTSAGGTGLTTYTAGDLSYYVSGSTLTKLAIGTIGQILTSTGSAPQWSTLSGVAVTTFSAGTTGFTPNSATSGAITLAGTLITSNGGTGLSSYTAGDLSYYASGTALTKLAIGAAGRFLSSTGSAPQWSAPAALTETDDTNVTMTLGGSPSTALLSAVSMTLGWTGTLAVSRGGTGTGTAFTAGSVIFAGASGVYSQKNASFFWDNTNNRLGLLTSAPVNPLDVRGSARLASDGIGGGAAANGVIAESISSFTKLRWEFYGASVNPWIGVNGASDSTKLLIGRDATTWANFSAAGDLSVGNGTGTAAQKLDVTGNIRTTGNVIIATSGQGIDFSATPGTGTSELFADYEEGTFTPVVTAAAGSITSYNASGTYVKIGKTVVFQMTFNITNPGTASGLVNFSGLPFTSQNVTDYVYEGRTRENNVSGASSDFLIVANNTTGIILTSTWASNQSYSLAGTYITA
jgi:hypothetical protein